MAKLLAPIRAESFVLSACLLLPLSRADLNKSCACGRKIETIFGSTFWTAFFGYLIKFIRDQQIFGSIFAPNLVRKNGPEVVSKIQKKSVRPLEGLGSCCEPVRLQVRWTTTDSGCAHGTLRHASERLPTQEPQTEEAHDSETIFLRFLRHRFLDLCCGCYGQLDACRLYRSA